MITIDKIIRSRRRSIALTVTREAQVVLRTPWNVPWGIVERFVEQHRDWIQKKLSDCREHPQPAARGYRDGEEFLFRGQVCKLKLAVGLEKVVVEGEFLFVPALDSRGISAVLKKWYREQARAVISLRVEAVAREHGFSFKSIRISSARGRWGSCGFRNSLNFPWRLVMAPDQVIDYVVIHELCHTIEKNHSGRFWARVNALAPDYKQSKAWLRKNHQLIALILPETSL
jgi:predicted metal-dependent hydrolase